MTPRRLAPRLALAVALAVTASLATAADTLRGEVLETRDADVYTYLRLKTQDGETWAAVPKASVAKGAQVGIENPAVMQNFRSKTLDRTFDRIVFGSLAGQGGAAPSRGPGALGAPTPAARPAPAVAAAPVKVAKASGPDGRTVAEVVGGKDKLKDKPVSVRAQVVKASFGIMGKNWLHLQDGSGSAGSNDITVITTDKAAVGDVVLVKGLVRTNVVIGPGYEYAVLIDQASVGR